MHLKQQKGSFTNRGTMITTASAIKKGVCEMLKANVMLDSVLLAIVVVGFLEGHLHASLLIKEALVSNVATVLLGTVGGALRLGRGESSAWPWSRVGRYAVAVGLGAFAGLWFSQGIL